MYKIGVFLVLCDNTEGTSYGRPEGLPSVAPSRCLTAGQQKNWGATLRARFAGGKAPIINLKY